MSVEPSGLCYRCFEKQSLQYTGLSAFGLKGTCVCFPQDAQVAGNISLSENLPAGEPALGVLPFEAPALFFRAARQSLQRVGSL